MATADPPTRVAILGGGIGAICTAFWLTATPVLRARYAVSVYTHGWRLGGKCASGRDAANGNRIQEHGLHMLMGWYQTAFQTIRACYAEWDKAPENPFQTWRDAFTPLREVTLTQQVPDAPGGQWHIWNVPFPRLPGTPGDPTDDFLHAVVHTALGWLHDYLANASPHLVALVPDLDPLRASHAAAQAGAAQAPAARADLYDGLLAALQAFQREFESYVEPLLALDPSQGYELCVFADFALAMLVGLLRDVLPDPAGGLNKLDDMEFRDWLRSAGANPKFLGSAPVRVLYDLSFAYANGDSSSIANGRIAAGAGLMALLRMTFAYKDAPLWKMNAGMGDTVFTPLYEVLRQRGVAIHFFHRVTNLGLSADGRAIDSVAMYRQVNLAAKDAYDPLVPVTANGRTLPCWPAQPKWQEIAGGEGIRSDAWDLESMWCTYRAAVDPDVTLRRGTDFDLVVLGIPPAALPDIGAELLAPGRCPAMRTMYDHTNSVSTQAAQLWLKPDLEGLGWTSGPTVLSAYADPFRSWGEMSHLLPMETWRWPSPLPGSCEYFCGTRPLPPAPPPYGDRDFPHQQTEQVRDAFGTWLQGEAATLWPAAASGGRGFNRDLLASEYYRVNIDPSELYVQTFPGTVKYRLAPGDSGIDNLVLAGDWTLGTVNGGCAEGAFESGKLAAQAICREAIDLPLERLPTFISYKGVGEVDYRAPLIATDDLLYAFAIPSNQSSVQALVDATLAAPASKDVAYHVLGNHVMLLFQHCGHFTSPEGIGWAEDRETAIMVPLIERRTGALSPPRLVLWMPYLMIDVGLGMITGRDVWGYNKSLGTTTMPLDPRDPAVFRCETLVFDTFAPQTQGLVQPLIEVTRTDAAGLGALTPSWTDAHGLLAAIERALGPWTLLHGAELAVDLLALLLGRDIPVINLKQMRDTRYTDLAVYQALVETMLVVSRFDTAGLIPGSHQVRVRVCDSHAIVRQLGLAAEGLKPGDFATVPATMGFWVKLDFNAPIGGTVWSSR